MQIAPTFASGPCPPSHVMVIEDDADIRAALVELLEGEGYIVDAAENGADALARLSEIARPCVILLDLMMPVMNGWQFLATRKDSTELSHIPVVVVSAMSQRTPASVEAIVPKPVDVSALLGVIEKLC
jgi:CheY-like chemotaxis protein